MSLVTYTIPTTGSITTGETHIIQQPVTITPEQAIQIERHYQDDPSLTRTQLLASFKLRNHATEIPCNS